MKVGKSISINPNILLGVEELIEAGKVSSFSWFVETTVANALENYK